MSYYLDIKNPDFTVRRILATEEQEVIINAALNTRDNLMLNALAGAAKTSTLQFLAKYLPIQPILCLAFNKEDRGRNDGAAPRPRQVSDA